MALMHIMSVPVSRGFRSSMKAGQLMLRICQFRIPVETALVVIL
jgi:hypothetical protein